MTVTASSAPAQLAAASAAANSEARVSIPLPSGPLSYRGSPEGKGRSQGTAVPSKYVPAVSQTSAPICRPRARPAGRRLEVDPAVAARQAGLVGRLGEGGPGQRHVGCAGTAPGSIGDAPAAIVTWAPKASLPVTRLQDLGRGRAEGAVARDVLGEGRRRDVGAGRSSPGDDLGAQVRPGPGAHGLARVEVADGRDRGARSLEPLAVPAPRCSRRAARCPGRRTASRPASRVVARRAPRRTGRRGSSARAASPWPARPPSTRRSLLWSREAGAELRGSASASSR